jgi:hypothetical protein
MGGLFGNGFEEEDVTFETWGRISLVFNSCNDSVLYYHGPEEWGDGELPLNRLTEILGLNCSENISGQSLLSGVYFDPQRSGEGWILEYLERERFVLYWYTYDLNGRQKWLLGVGEMIHGALEFDDVLEVTGGVFGDSFDPDSIQSQHWGRVTIEPMECQISELRFWTESEYGSSGPYSIQKLFSPYQNC